MKYESLKGHGAMLGANAMWGLMSPHGVGPGMAPWPFNDSYFMFFPCL